MLAVARTFSSTLQHRLGVERHFALVEICQANLGLASNRRGSRTQSDPTISSISTSIMITTSNSPVKGSGMPNHYGGDLLHTMAMSGLSRVRTELLHSVVVPAAAPHPVQLDCQLPRHRHLGDLARMTWEGSGPVFYVLPSQKSWSNRYSFFPAHEKM